MYLYARKQEFALMERTHPLLLVGDLHRNLSGWCIISSYKHYNKISNNNTKVLRNDVPTNAALKVFINCRDTIDSGRKFHRDMSLTLT